MADDKGPELRQWNATKFLEAALEMYKTKTEEYAPEDAAVQTRIPGRVMMALFPGGLGLATVQEFNCFTILTQMVMKLSRYATNFESGGHTDSLMDLAVYAAMLDEMDLDRQSQRKKKIR